MCFVAYCELTVSVLRVLAKPWRFATPAWEHTEKLQSPDSKIFFTGDTALLPLVPRPAYTVGLEWMQFLTWETLVAQRALAEGNSGSLVGT